MRREIGGKELGKRRARDAGASVFTTNPSRAGPCLNDVGKRHIFFFCFFSFGDVLWNGDVVCIVLTTLMRHTSDRLFWIHGGQKLSSSTLTVF